MLSRLNNKPIKELNIWEQSLLFAELSQIAYQSEPNALNNSRKIGFDDAEFFDHKGAQVYIFKTKYDNVIACRGTEPSEFNDIKADIKAWPVKSKTFGYVHAGFKQEADKIWKQSKTEIVNDKKTTWFTGHSLGGAMTTICAARCHHHAPTVDIGGIFTYGSPRAGWRTFVKKLKVEHFRWINNADIVTKVPLWTMGYVHHGTIKYLNTWGNVRDFTYWQRFKDRYRAIWRGLFKGRVDPFSDHAVGDYVKFISNKVQGKETEQK